MHEDWIILALVGSVPNNKEKVMNISRKLNILDIACLSGFSKGTMGSSAAEDSLNGYLKAMADAKYEVWQDMVVYGNLTYEFGATLAAGLCQHYRT